MKDFHDVIDKDEAIFHAVRQRGMLFAQPVTNFVAHRMGLEDNLLRDCIPGASGESFYKADGVTFDAEGPRDVFGDKIYFAHWAGAVSLPAAAFSMRLGANSRTKPRADEARGNGWTRHGLNLSLDCRWAGF